jgi:uncharacterized membrane protein YeaQ/YmgE (transglycosylase-associated protein family)
MGIITWILFGLVIGLLARAIVPGRQQMGIIMTTVLGVAGSLVGGLVATLVTGGRVAEMRGSGFIGSLVGAIALLVIAGLVMKPQRRAA